MIGRNVTAVKLVRSRSGTLATAMGNRRAARNDIFNKCSILEDSKIAK
jgi:hypothetical protein